MIPFNTASRIKVSLPLFYTKIEMYLERVFGSWIHFYKMKTIITHTYNYYVVTTKFFTPKNLGYSSSTSSAFYLLSVVGKNFCIGVFLPLYSDNNVTIF